MMCYLIWRKYSIIDTMGNDLGKTELKFLIDLEPKVPTFLILVNLF